MADNANIKVDWDVLADKGKDMKTEAGKMKAALDEIAKTILNLNTEEGWKSNASERMYQEIEKIQKNTFPNYEKIVNEYGVFLETASSTYSKVDQQLAEEVNKTLMFD